MKYQAIFVALLAREAAAKCKSVTPSSSYAASSSSASGSASYGASSASSTLSYVLSTTSSSYDPSSTSSVYLTTSSSASGSSSSSVSDSYSSSASYSSSSSESSSSSYVSSTTSSIASTTSSTVCPTPTDFLVGTGSCDCAYDVLDGFAIEGATIAILEASNYENCLWRCDQNTDCDSFSFKAYLCRMYNSRVNDGVTSVEDANAKSGSLILGTCQGACTNPHASSDYVAPVVEDTSTCVTTFAKKPPAYIRTTVEITTLVQTDPVTATSTEVSITTPTSFTTTTEITTSVTTSTELQVTDTFVSTSTVYSTSTETQYTTDTDISTTWSTVTVAPTTYTVPAAAGFTPIKSANTRLARSVNRVLAGRTVSASTACPAPTPVLNEGDIQSYATAVACGTTTVSTTVSTVSTSITTEVLTAAPTTVTATDVSTLVSTTTEVPVPAETTVTVITTEVVPTTTVLPTTTTTVTTSTTTTTVGATPTVYAQCLANNMATTVNGQTITSFSYSYNYVNKGTVATVADCCVLCVNEAHCGAFALSSAGTCFLAKDSGTCNGSQKAATVSHSSSPFVSAYKGVGNGACGQVRV
ncbi:hypothetical protein Hte_000570 [Hypoxylon texense]